MNPTNTTIQVHCAACQETATVLCALESVAGPHTCLWCGGSATLVYHAPLLALVSDPTPEEEDMSHIPTERPTGDWDAACRWLREGHPVKRQTHNGARVLKPSDDSTAITPGDLTSRWERMPKL